MGATEISAAWSAAQPVIEALIALGLPGVVLMLAAIPALVVALAFVMNYRHAKKREAVLEAYRKDTRIILDEMGAKHAEVTEFYRKNVSLVKNYERMTDLLQTLVINNTRAMEHLSTIIEHRSIS